MKALCSVQPVHWYVGRYMSHVANCIITLMRLYGYDWACVLCVWPAIPKLWAGWKGVPYSTMRSRATLFCGREPLCFPSLYHSVWYKFHGLSIKNQLKYLLQDSPDLDYVRCMFPLFREMLPCIAGTAQSTKTVNSQPQTQWNMRSKQQGENWSSWWN
jgi:hypothetical protein